MDLNIYRLVDSHGKVIAPDAEGDYRLHDANGGTNYYGAGHRELPELVAAHNSWHRQAGTLDSVVKIQRATGWTEQAERVTLKEGSEFGVIIDGVRYIFRLTGEASAEVGKPITDVHGSLIPDLPF